MPSQRDVLRRLVERFGMNEETVIREYAAAEKRGEARRDSNKYSISAEDYARALRRNGVRKGWIR